MALRLSGWLAVIALATAACTNGPAGTTETVAVDTSAEAPPATASPGTTSGPSTAEAESARSFAGTDPAPEFPADLDWLNTEQALTLAGLRGKIVLLDFWTYGCINCIHIIPDLERLEKEFAEELVVIGVHSAKFVNESATENIRQVILRYGLEHPVVNDRDFEVWNSWGARAWPTTVLIDPAGNIVGGHSGENVYNVVQPVIRSLIEEFDAAGNLDRSPTEFALEADRGATTVLSFPGKVFAAEGQLFIADSGNHRVVQAEAASGDVVAVYGRGTPGFDDGPALEATFDSPQGMELSADGKVLYVADTNNHAIRTIDLSSGDVGTLVGTGRLAWPPTGGLVPQVGLNSPWDIVRNGERLYIAMAGHHQLWTVDLASGIAGPAVGSSREGTRNGPIAEAELAQPSGLVFDANGRLYFADSESSSIRYADVLEGGGETGIVAGSDVNLFEFGDTDGRGTEARLQHPLGVAYWQQEDALLVADTYNSKLKRIDLDTYETTTFLGGEQGWADGAAPQFYEPGGLHLDGGTLYVADTNNHAIRIVDLRHREASTLVLKGIDRFNPPPDDSAYRGTIIRLDPVAVAAGPGSFRLDIGLPEDFKVNEDAPSSVAWAVSGGVAELAPDADRSLTGVTFPVDVGVEFISGEGAVTADLTVIYCREDAESLCFIEQVRFEVPVAVAGNGATAVDLSHDIGAPGV